MSGAGSISGPAPLILYEGEPEEMSRPDGKTAVTDQVDGVDGTTAGTTTGTVDGAADTRPAGRKGAPDWTSARVALLEERARLSSERASLQAGLEEVIRDSSAGSGDDQADSGAKTFGREHEQVLLDRVAEAMDQTERALARIEDGTYGVCESCGEQIGAARLEAYPRATLCVTCKQRAERR